MTGGFSTIQKIVLDLGTNNSIYRLEAACSSHPQAHMEFVGKNNRICPGKEHLYRRLSVVRECARIQTFP
jgi:hypothetical protein